jgi:ubiquinone biosynthesis protein UbiJ
LIGPDLAAEFAEVLRLREKVAKLEKRLQRAKRRDVVKRPLPKQRG